MKTITTSQLKKVKQIEKELNVDLDSDNMSEFEAHHVILSYNKINGNKKQTKEETKTPSNIIIKKVNLTEEEKELYDY